MHPTVKPVGLVADAILDCSRRGDLVLDSFGGSGSPKAPSHTGGRGGTLNGASNSGSGGGAGCAARYVSATTYTYSLSAGGTAGTAGTWGAVAIVGDPAKLIIEEF